MSGNDGESHYGDYYRGERRGRNDSPELRRGSTSYYGAKDSHYGGYSNGNSRGGSYHRGDSREDGRSRRGNHQQNFKHDSRSYGAPSDSNGRQYDSSHSYQSYPSQRHDSKPYFPSSARDSAFSSYDRSRSSGDNYSDYRDRRSPVRDRHQYDDPQRSSRTPQFDRYEKSDVSPRQLSSSGYRSSESSMDMDMRGSYSEVHRSESSHPYHGSNQICSSDSAPHSSSNLSHSTSSYRSHEELHKPQSSNGRGDAFDRELLSMSRASTQPLDGFGPSHPPSASSSMLQAPSMTSSLHSSVMSTSSMHGGPEKRGSTFSSFTRTVLHEMDPSSFATEDYATLKSALESSANSLQTIQTMEAELAKTQSRELQLCSLIDEAENAAQQLYIEYYTSDYQLRVTEGDHEAVTRIVNSLDATNGEWPDQPWSFHHYQSFDDIIATETQMEATDPLPLQELPPLL